MKYGLCCSLENASLAVKAGFDYVELGAGLFQGLDPNYMQNPFAGLPVEATNLFFVGSLRLFGAARTPVFDYVKRTVERAANAGVKVMVIGSGGVRRAPDGLDAATALEGFIRVAEMAQSVASRCGIVIAPESLNRSETNVGNDLPSLAVALRSVGVGYTPDTYHVLYEEGQGEIDWAAQIPFMPDHVHIGNRARVVFGPDEPELIGAATRLRDLGYDGRISYEGAIEPSQYSGQLAAMKAIFG